MDDETDAVKNVRIAFRTAVSFLIEKGLYSSVETESAAGMIVNEYLSGDRALAFDNYCVDCRREVPFRVSKKEMARGAYGSQNAVRLTLRSINAVCQRSWHSHTYILKVDDAKLTKIGQYPSLADLAFGELRAFETSVNEEDRAELGRALGLFAHDTALGAFVYLRRVFERMIFRAHNYRSAAVGTIEGFSKLPMDQKISQLDGYIPDQVVRNSAVFSVLSLGIHELTESQCMDLFPVVKAVIFQMLEAEEHRRKAAIKSAETDAAFQRVMSGVSGGV